MGLAQKTVLHAGCGSQKVHEAFEGWQEIRVDVSPAVNPAIVASIVSMPQVLDQSVDAVYCSHVLEHLYAHEVPAAMREFRRVLKPGGLALVIVPDMQCVGENLANDKAETPIYAMEQVGRICALDMLYGHRASVALGNLHMAHHTGFTASVLKARLIDAGFENVQPTRDGNYNLWAKAYKPKASE